MRLLFASFGFAALAPMAVRAQDDRLCGTSKQADYRGDVSVTANGRTCQNWTHQTPHAHSNTPQNRPGKGLGDHNHCRNPDGEPKAWCYTTDPAKRWELCDVPDCATHEGTYGPGGDLSPEAVAAVTQGMIDGKYSTATGWCVNAANGDLVDKFQQDGVYATDADGPATCYQFCEPFSGEPGFVGVQWRSMSKGARCICYFDDGKVPTLLPEGTSTVTGNPSVGPVTGSGDADHFCMAYKAYMNAERQAIYGNGPLTDYVDMEVHGANTQVANVMVEYDQNQNPVWEGMSAPAFSADHTTITATGNTWSAYLLPAPVEVHKDTILQFNFTLNEETVDGFQAVCLDINTEETGSDGKCFVLRSSQGWVSRMINVPTQTGVGETSTHSIPVGDFFTGTVNYLAVIQDSDGQDRSTGSSSISDMKLIDLVDDYLQIEIDGTMQNLENNQVRFSNKGNNEDTGDYWMALSEDHTSVQINGNQWKALPLNAPYDVTANTIIEFDITIDQSVDYHAVCLDANTNIEQGRECVVIQNQKESASSLHHITTKLDTGVPKRIVIPFGNFMNLAKDEVMTVNYLAFIQDNDQSAKENGRSTWSGFKLYEDPTRYPLKIMAFGEEVVVDNIQEPLHNNAGEIQDSRDHLMSVSSEGHKITATSNSWKLLRLPQSFLVTPATVLKFKFEVPQQTELHAICLLDEEHIKDSRPDCFFTAGVQTHASTQGVKVEPYTPEGEMRSYEIIAGSHFTGEVKYLGFIVDNDLGFTTGDVERIYGQSSWSDIEIYNLPSLQIGYGDSTIEVENHQQSYDQGQDTTPIRNYMATIDGPSISFSGNVWRALELPEAISPAELGDFVLSFDFEVAEAAEIHAICLEENREFGDADNPKNVDPRRCIATAFFQNREKVETVMFADYQTRVGEGHRYALNLAKMFDRMYTKFRFLAFIHDNDAGDKRSGNSTYSNIAITANLSSCLDAENFSFSLEDCTVANFLGEIQAAMEAKGTCAQSDPLIELMAIFDATQETDVYNGIEKICSEAYKSEQYDFADNSLGIDPSTERQLVREYIDGGTVMNYETEADSAVNVGYVNEQHAGSRLLSWPKHHALDNCDIGAAMCCFVASRTGSAPSSDNSDVCYVNMKSSRRTARVADGWSVYDNEEDVYCEGFAWGKDGGSLATALRGNALFNVGFADNFLKGDVEQVPGAPLCGCVDRMPVVTNADCTDVTAPGSSVEVSFDATAGLFRSSFTVGTIAYGNCGGAGLVEHYETLVEEGTVTEADVAYMKKRVVGDGGCRDAINRFLSNKGLVMS